MLKSGIEILYRGVDSDLWDTSPQNTHKKVIYILEYIDIEETIRSVLKYDQVVGCELYHTLLGSIQNKD